MIFIFFEIFKMKLIMPINQYPIIGQYKGTPFFPVSQTTSVEKSSTIVKSPRKNGIHDITFMRKL